MHGAIVNMRSHIYYLAMLDAGEHWCIVCHAKNSELAPSCPGHRLAAHLHAAQAKSNLLSLGPDAWKIVSEVSEGDATLTTVVHRGDKVAP
jgi:sarcosine oxidase gamma subunit